MMDKIKKQEPLQVKFSFLNINTLEYSYAFPQNYIPKESKIRFDIKPSLGINKKAEDVRITITVLAKLDEDEIYFAKITSEFIFAIQEMDKHVTWKNNKFKFNNSDILVTLFSISYSTLRGILHEKGAGTILQKEILPVIDPKSFVNK